VNGRKNFAWLSPILKRLLLRSYIVMISLLGTLLELGILTSFVPSHWT